MYFKLSNCFKQILLIPVIPTQPRIQRTFLDSRLRGNDGIFRKIRPELESLELQFRLNGYPLLRICEKLARHLIFKIGLLLFFTVFFAHAQSYHLPEETDSKQSFFISTIAEAKKDSFFFYGEKAQPLPIAEFPVLLEQGETKTLLEQGKLFADAPAVYDFFYSELPLDDAYWAPVGSSVRNLRILGFFILYFSFLALLFYWVQNPPLRITGLLTLIALGFFYPSPKVEIFIKEGSQLYSISQKAPTKELKALIKWQPNNKAPVYLSRFPKESFLDKELFSTLEKDDFKLSLLKKNACSFVGLRQYYNTEILLELKTE